tara:strand:- start:551 stop:1051 length:501 start_codon:yes stop_codon:yes gene_type:complete
MNEIEIDENDENVWDEIYNNESNYIDHYGDSEEYYIDKNYYIGLYCITDTHILESSITVNSLLKYSAHDCLIYLNNHCIFNRKRRNSIEIMQFTPIKCGSLSVYKIVVKTFWLRLVQRNWKRICRERNKIIRSNILGYLKKREYEFERVSIPGLSGMLSHLNPLKI